jgi:hypothetical protein
MWKKALLFTGALICLLAPAAVPAYAAYDPLQNACDAGGSGGNVRDTPGCTGTKTDPISGQNGMLMKVSLVLGTIGGIAAVIIIIVAGLSYVTANGDASKAASARSAIIGAIVGLVVIAGAEGIVIFVVHRIS